MNDPRILTRYDVRGDTRRNMKARVSIVSMTLRSVHHISATANIWHAEKLRPERLLLIPHLALTLCTPCLQPLQMRSVLQREPALSHSVPVPAKYGFIFIFRAHIEYRRIDAGLKNPYFF